MIIILKIGLAITVPNFIYVTQKNSIAKSVPNFIYVTQIKPPKEADKK